MGEDAGYEGGEGQRLRPRGRLRGAVQSCQAEGVQGRGRGGRADDEGEAAGDRAGPHHREARHCHPPAGGEGEAAGRQRARDERLEKTEEKMVAAVAKLDKAATAADDSERAKKVFQNKADEDEKRISALEKDLKEAREKAEAADAHYDEVAKKLATCESELEKAEERADVGETKILELEEELRVVANNLKSLEVAEEKANQREKTYKEQIKTLSAKLKQAEARAEFAEKSVLKLQKEVDRLEDELVSEQEKYKAITEELEQTFAEMSGY